MNASDFAVDMPGEWVKTGTGHDAFVPASLPPRLPWTNDLICTLSAADRALGRLAGLGSGNLGGVNPHLLIRPFLRREAVLSSQIEGTHATLADLFLFEEAAAIEKQVPDVREVSNYVLALEYGLEQLKIRPLSRSLIKELHKLLMTDVRGGDKTPGAFREVQVVIGPTTRIEDARYVPPPPLLVGEAMEALEQYLEQLSDLPPLVRLSLVHYQFEAIHPFQDGNGRIGRLIITLMLCSQGILPLPMLYLSAYFEKRRQDYYRHLLQVSQRAAWSEWITFFLRGVTHEATDAIERATRLMTLRHEYHAKLQKARLSALSIKLVDALFETPAVTLKRTSTLLQLTPAAAQKHIDRLIDAGIIHEATHQKRNRVYLAAGILSILGDDNLAAAGSSLEERRSTKKEDNVSPTDL